MKKTVLASFAVFCILYLSTCFSPWAGEDGESSLTVHVGSLARSVFYTLAEDNVNSFSHEISIRDDKGNFIVESRKFSGSSVTIGNIRTGRTYSLSIKGYEGDTLRSYGIESEITIKQGRNTVTVDMFSAVDVSDFDSFNNVLKKANELTVQGRTLYVFINNTISVSNSLTYPVNANVILIPEKANNMFDVGGFLTLGTSDMTGTITINVNEGTHSLCTVSDNGNIALNVGNPDNKTVPLINVSGGSFTLGAVNMRGDAITLTGSGNNETSLIRVSGGELILNSSATITDNNNKNYGGGVWVGDGGKFTMNGGEICNNQAAGSGGVNVGKNGTFTMNGGEIHHNTVESGGGGVQVWPVDGTATFIMSGGSIHDNTADNGGGVQIGVNEGVEGKATFTMTDGRIDNNYATGGNGGGVQVLQNGEFTLSGGTISANIAFIKAGEDGSGGGVNIWNGIFIKTGGIIYGYEPNDLNNSNAIMNIENIENNEVMIDKNGHAVFAGMMWEDNIYIICYRDDTANTNDHITFDYVSTPYKDECIKGLYKSWGEGEIVRGTYGANAPYNSFQGLTSESGYQIVDVLGNEENYRANVMKIDKPKGFSVVYYNISSAYRNKQITITFSTDVKREGMVGDLCWQVNNETSVGNIPKFPEVGEVIKDTIGKWESMVGALNVIPTEVASKFYLTAWDGDNNPDISEKTTYYIANFKIEIR